MAITYRIGLTGGIGCGKSTVADMFAARGAAIVDTDVISRQLTSPGCPAVALIEKDLGPGLLRSDGSLDRERLRKQVFSDQPARNKLEAILHPLIRAEVQRQLQRAAAPYALVVVPLLLETGAYDQIVQRVLVVDCEENLQVRRVMARNQLTENEVRSIMAAQSPRRDRLSLADDVIENNGNVDALESQVAALHAKYLQLANQPHS